MAHLAHQCTRSPRRPVSEVLYVGLCNLTALLLSSLWTLPHPPLVIIKEVTIRGWAAGYLLQLAVFPDTPKKNPSARMWFCFVVTLPPLIVTFQVTIRGGKCGKSRHGRGDWQLPKVGLKTWRTTESCQILCYCSGRDRRSSFPVFFWWALDTFFRLLPLVCSL